MTALFLVGIPLLLLGSFVALTRYETESGVRVWAERRMRFDLGVERWSAFLANVDFVALFRDGVSFALHHAGHALTHASLVVVRWVERLLTRLIRFFHAREAALEPGESTRAFVKTLSEFKEQLRSTIPADLKDSLEE